MTKATIMKQCFKSNNIYTTNKNAQTNLMEF